MTLFSTIEENVLHLLNDQGRELVRGISLNSTRTIGDAVQLFLSEKGGLEKCIPQNLLKSFENDFERRSMEDMAFYDKNNHYYAIDCKTHNLNTQFNMPNLISVRRLANFYKNDANTFCILIVEYKTNNNKIEYTNCHLKAIEDFSWDCLTLGALGWGQIQIANANSLSFNSKTNRKEWMLELCKNIELFYDEEILKIKERKTWFNEIKNYWETK